MFVVNRSRTRSAVVQWDFNAWGEKYDTLLKDARIPDLMASYLQVPYFRPGAVLEGGSIDGNGVGTILTTEQCLLNPNRNHGLSQGDIEGLVAAYTGAKNIVWLEGGISGDDTDGHVDTVARFVGTNTILCAYEDNPSDDNHAVLAENYRRLCAASDQDGNSFEIIKIPMPRPVARNVGEDCARLPATYLNFYAGNASVLMPTFNDPMDERVFAILQDAFPGRAVIAIDSVDLISGFGGLHCITQQEPQAGQTR
jgi:agmatine deiminase